MNWYGKNNSNGQGLIIEEETGRNVAVSYDEKDTNLLAAAPELLKFAQDILRYVEAGTISTKSDRQFVAMRAREVINLSQAE